jgi:hypothetical protein
MLKVRAEHLTPLSDQQAAGFTARMVLHLREVFPQEVAPLDDAKLQAFIEKVCAQGERWGIRQEPLVERLIELFVSFEELRRDPLPRSIGDSIARILHARRSTSAGARVLLTLEKNLLFHAGPMRSAEWPQGAASAGFCRLVDLKFYGEVRTKNAGSLPPDLVEVSGSPRALTISSADGWHRRRWKAVAAQLRDSRAIPGKDVRSASAPWLEKASGTRFAAVPLATKGGGVEKVPILQGGRKSW